MKKRIIPGLIVFLLFFSFLTVMTMIAEKSAKEVRDGVVRFHIVANSDSDSDQQNKYALRDGIAVLCNSLFENSKSKEQSLKIARDNKEIIEQKAKEILQQKDCNDNVYISVTKRFFPTRHYEGVSLPAGVYDTIDVKIGKAEGQNFWCVMFPGICIGGSSKQNKEKMQSVLSKDGYELVTQKTPEIKFKFKLIELFQMVKNRF